MQDLYEKRFWNLGKSYYCFIPKFQVEKVRAESAAEKTQLTSEVTELKSKLSTFETEKNKMETDLSEKIKKITQLVRDNNIIVGTLEEEKNPYYILILVKIIKMWSIDKL